MPDLGDRIRAWLGTDHIAALNRRLDAQEATMSEILTMLHGLVAQNTEASAAQQASFLNLHNSLQRQEQTIREINDQLAAALENNGKITPEIQALGNQLSQGFTDIKKAAETADDGFEPVEAPDGTDVPPSEDALPDVETPAGPVSEQPTVEVPADVPAEGDTGTAPRGNR